MADPTYAFPFDPTGTLASNKITGEQQVITPANYRDFHYIVPTYAPFFAVGLVVKFRDATNVVRTLVEGVDYYLSHWFISASRACATPIYGSISFLNLDLSGVVIIDYQTLGGMWTQDSATLAEIAGDLVHNPRITAWDVVVNMPVSFPVIDHQWDLVDLVGASDVVTALGNIELALRSTGSTGLASHLVDYGNPHRVTAAQVGLGNVQNYGVADGPTTVAGAVSNLYTTPYGVKQAMDAGPTAAINAHTVRTDNPHAVTAAQTGAYTQLQVNSLLTGKLDTTAVAYDTSRFNGLSPTEYRDWAMQTGVASNSLEFNGMTAGDYKTWVLTGQAADSLKLNGNTYAQVLAAAQAQTAANATLFAGYTYAQAKADILTGTAANATMFNGMTQAQYTAYLGGQFGSAGSVAKAATQPYTNADAVGNYWMEIGRAYYPTAGSLPTAQDAHWLIAGGDSNGGTVSSLRLLQLSTRGATGDGVVKQLLLNFSGVADGARIGYTVEMLDNGSGTMVNTVRVWMEVAANHGAITVTELARGTSQILGSSPEVTVEPAGITYFTEDISGLASAASVAQLRTDVQNSLDQLTNAFTALATQVTAS